MNYETKYKDILKRIKKLLDNAKNQGHILVRVEDIENTFPELKRSWDEKEIRENCIKYLDREYQHCPLNEDKIKIEECITWLEKQDSNLVENGYTDNKDYIKYADNYSRQIWHKLMDNFKNIKDYHIGCNDVSDIVLNAIVDTCNWLEKQSKQKQTWKPSAAQLIVIEDLIEDENTSKVNKVILQGMLEEFDKSKKSL